MNYLELLTFVAILSSPVIALQVDKFQTKRKEKERRKEEIFNVLMETRAQTLSYEHVRALNKIDVAFYYDKKVRERWENYRDHLNSYPNSGSETDQKIWTDKIPEKLSDLLFEMATLLNYDFSKMLLVKGSYIPLAHDIIENEQKILRRALVETLAFKKPISVKLVNDDNKADDSC